MDNAITELSDKLKAVFENIIYGWFLDMINSWISELTGGTTNMIDMSLHIENATGMTGGIITAEAIELALFAIYLVLLGLLAVKLCWKGYKIYVLELDGEADLSPLTLLKNAVYALCVAVAFPIVYDITTELVVILGDKIFHPFSEYTLDNFFASLTGIFSGGFSRTFIIIILAFVFIIAAICLWIKMTMQGFELLIFRLGVPLAVVGLIDSDGGIWKSYLQQFIRQMATILVQGFCVKLAVVITASATGGSLVCGIALLLLAFKMPKMMSSMLVAGGGGGSSIATLSMVARTFIRGV